MAEPKAIAGLPQSLITLVPKPDHHWGAQDENMGKNQPDGRVRGPHRRCTRTRAGMAPNLRLDEVDVCIAPPRSAREAVAVSDLVCPRNHHHRRRISRHPGGKHVS